MRRKKWKFWLAQRLSLLILILAGLFFVQAVGDFFQRELHPRPQLVTYEALQKQISATKKDPCPPTSNRGIYKNKPAVPLDQILLIEIDCDQNVVVYYKEEDMTEQSYYFFSTKRIKQWEMETIDYLTPVDAGTLVRRNIACKARIRKGRKYFYKVELTVNGSKRQFSSSDNCYKTVQREIRTDCRQ